MFKYKVIKNAISYDLANFIFNYFLLKRDAAKFMYDNNIIHDNGMFGTWVDTQIPNTYSHYADPVMETLLVKMLPVMKEQTGLDLIPTYSYARAYKKGDELKRHKDRFSCEISTTMNLGGDPWPVYLEPNCTKGGWKENYVAYVSGETKGIEVNLKPGDMLIYRGDAVEHWRDQLWGNNHAQVFLHYNEKDGQYDIPYDGRPLLGMPASLRNKDLLDVNEKKEEPNIEDNIRVIY